VQANLDQVFIAAASRVGSDDGFGYLGSSVIVDPHGRIQVGPASQQAETVEVVRLNLAEARRAKVRSPLITPLADRRVDVYATDLGYRGDPPAAYPPMRPVAQSLGMTDQAAADQAAAISP
jgi:hypothetical protein